MPKPRPARISAIATTRPNIETCSAKNATLSAVARAVSVTQMLRAVFSIGRPVFGSVAAAEGSFVSFPSAVR